MTTGGGRGRGRGRRGTSKRTQARDETFGSDPDYEVSSPKHTAELATPADRGKGIARESSCQGGSRARESRSKHAAKVSSEQRSMYSSRSCIAERHVNFPELINEVATFGRLLQRVSIEPVGCVLSRGPFCVELIREFYMNETVLAEDTINY